MTKAVQGVECDSDSMRGDSDNVGYDSDNVGDYNDNVGDDSDNAGYDGDNTGYDSLCPRPLSSEWAQRSSRCYLVPSCSGFHEISPYTLHTDIHKPFNKDNAVRTTNVLTC